MGKNLKGRECGKGIYQRKDGLYGARFVDRAGKRHEKYFQTVPEARNWIADAKYVDAHANERGYLNESRGSAPEWRKNGADTESPKPGNL